MKSPTHLCKDCGSKIKPISQPKGSFVTEICVWLISLFLALFSFGITLLIAIIYSAWRICSRRKICPICESESFIPLNSPAAKVLETKQMQPEPIQTSLKIDATIPKMERYKL